MPLIDSKEPLLESDLSDTRAFAPELADVERRALMLRLFREFGIGGEQPRPGPVSVRPQ